MKFKALLLRVLPVIDLAPSISSLESNMAFVVNVVVGKPKEVLTLTCIYFKFSVVHDS